MASVLTSAHALCTSGTIAPSTLTCKRSDGADGKRPACSSARTAAVSAASSVAPAVSVSRRAVSALIGTRVKCPSTAGTRSNGSQVPSRTILWCTNGASLPASRPSSSSRGKKTGATLGARGVGPLQFHYLIAGHGQAPCVFSPRLYRPTTRRARWPLLQVGRGARQGGPLEQARPQARQPLFHRPLDLRERRPRMCRPPVGQPAIDFLAQPLPLRFPIRPRHCRPTASSVSRLPAPGEAYS